MRRRFEAVFYSFPFQLVILQMRSSQLLLALWLGVVLFISGAFGRKLGLQYLFLDPEYLGGVHFGSFFFVGFTLGGFWMTWNLTTYLLTAHHFPFLASLSRPFTKFCINNAFLPLVFLIYYMVSIISFESKYEQLPGYVVFINCLGLLMGVLSLLMLNMIYFYFTNKDIFSYNLPAQAPPDQSKSIAPGRRGIDLDLIKQDSSRWRVTTYLTEACQPRMVRSVAHYDSRLLMNIFRQNHLNALVIQLFSMLLLMGLGQLIDYSYFRIPAAASIFIFGSVIMAIIGALIYWFDHWWVTVFVGLLLILNYFTSFEILSFRNKAYGLNYKTEAAEYTYEKLQHFCDQNQIKKDKTKTIAILEKWLQKNKKHSNDKPKMVFLCVSGGGLRSATWSMNVVQTVDSLLKGELLRHTTLITGASGGMIGMAYLRELLLQEQLGNPLGLYDPIHLQHISKDLLNSVAFTIVTNDMFLPWNKFQSGGYTYGKDRGYIFEKQLNENTDGLLDKTLGDYLEPEANALIPMMYVTPMIVNDARRLVISPQQVSFMMTPPIGTINSDAVEVDAVDFGWLFQNQDAQNLRFLTALRMNATYPYILPNVYLPSNPGIEVMDAGLRDNYGILSATRFIQVFKDWILENTSGVILVQISSSEK
ncbi:MAG: patatin-like phospholipase family protein, partial [Saprospiraceae bacterium]|nr:patatin-like phospholipase family protein [Saprospiraceae bacterium]